MNFYGVVSSCLYYSRIINEHFNHNSNSNSNIGIDVVGF